MKANKGGGGGGKAAYTFCRVCRINHNHGPKHKFHSKHQYALTSSLKHEAEKIAELRLFASQRLTGGLFSGQRWCLFCDKDTTTKDTAFLSMLQHLSSKEHKKNMIEFLKEMGSNENRSKFYFQKNVLKQFVSNGNERNDATPDTPNGNGSGPASPVADGATSSSSVDKKDDLNEVKVPRTVVSVNGIRQNPTGWDNGERVWGGGIVKYKREGEWQPWPIDLDNEADMFDPSSLMGGTMIAGLHSSAQNNIVTSAPTATLSANGVFTHPSLATAPEGKQTEYAYSAELTRVDPLPLQVGQGNVHSGALPPWMVDETGSAIPTITPFVPLSERERRGKKRQIEHDKKKDKIKVGANVERKANMEDPNWLPNFGSVWTAGPRSETRRNFKEGAVPKTARPGNAGLQSMDIHTKLVNKNKQQEFD